MGHKQLYLRYDLPLQQRADLFDRLVEVISLGLDELKDLAFGVAYEFAEDGLELHLANPQLLGLVEEVEPVLSLLDVAHQRVEDQQGFGYFGEHPGHHVFCAIEHLQNVHIVVVLPLLTLQR